MAGDIFQLGFVLKGVDLLSGALTNASRNLGKLYETGERMVNFGERMTLAAGLASEGIEQIRLASDAIQEPAIAMQQAMARMAAITGLSGEALADIKEKAIAFSSVHPGTTAEEYIQAFTQMRGIFQDTSKAFEATDTARMLNKLGVENAAATKIITIGWNNLNTSAKMTGDELARTVSTFGLAPAAMNQVAAAAGRLGPEAAASNSSMAELLALVGESQKITGGGRGAMAFIGIVKNLETLTAKGKLSLDWSHGMTAALEQLRQKVLSPGWGTPAQRLADMKVGNIPEVLALLTHLDDVKKAQTANANAAGDLASKEKTATDNYADSVTKLTQNWKNFGDALATPALPTETNWMNKLSDALLYATGLADRHQDVSAGLAITLKLVGDGASYAMKALNSLGAIYILLGLGTKGLGSLFGGSSAATAAGETAAAAGEAAEATEAVAVAATGIVWPVAGAIAIAGAAYETYTHWDQIKGAIRDVNEEMKKGVITKTPAEESADIKKNIDAYKHAMEGGPSSILMKFRDWGIEAMKLFGEGVLAGNDSVTDATRKVMAAAAKYLPSHSPAELGPLSTLDRLPFGETFARSIRPEPVLGAMRRLAAAATFTGAATLPMILSSSGYAGTLAAGAGGAGSVNIVINYAPVLNVSPDDVSTPDAWMKAARIHSQDLVRIIDHHLSRGKRSRMD